MAPEVEEQLRTVFQRLGLEPKEIRHNNSLDRWLVSIQADGSDEQYLRPIDVTGSGGAVDYVVDFPAVTSMRREIDGTLIPAGTIHVETIEDEYFKITIE